MLIVGDHVSSELWILRLKYARSSWPMMRPISLTCVMFQAAASALGAGKEVGQVALMHCTFCTPWIALVPQ
jgi:hypothetical protein